MSLASVTAEAFDFLREVRETERQGIPLGPVLEPWKQWALAMSADPDGPCPGLPGWMQPMAQHWHPECFLDRPAVARLVLNDESWISLARYNKDDLSVEIARTRRTVKAPTLRMLDRAWASAYRSSLPTMTITFVPARPWGRAVTGLIEAFEIFGSSPDVIANQTQLLGPPDATHEYEEEGQRSYEWKWADLTDLE